MNNGRNKYQKYLYLSNEVSIFVRIIKKGGYMARDNGGCIGCFLFWAIVFMSLQHC